MSICHLEPAGGRASVFWWHSEALGGGGACQKAITTRDALLPDMQKSVKNVKIHAASIWADDPATLSSLFAPPEAVPAPTQQRRKKTDAKAIGDKGVSKMPK